MSALSSGFGWWHPLVWLGAFFLALLLGFLIRALGNKQYKKGTEQTKPFLSGNEESDPNVLHVRASNLYWGYLETLKGYYDKLTALHTGNPVDYLLWFFGSMALILLLGLII
ncbi:hydrogenase [candidate division FCPU426 bacterium]|nr:hydrogenase [candidate division FCPU426 bacterium]